jgi:flagellar motor switch protein FliN/FliY
MPESNGKRPLAGGAGKDEEAKPVKGPSDVEIDSLLKELGLGAGGGHPAPKVAPAKPDAAVDSLIAELAAGEKPPQARPTVEKPFKLAAFDKVEAPAEDDKLELLMDVNLSLKVELGRTKLLIRDILKLGKGAVVELDKLAGDPLDILVNEKLVARGEVLILNDNFCIRVTEILTPRQNK